jgi:hypothetical protein
VVPGVGVVALNAELPSRDETPGRGLGSGWWLEERFVEALEGWGYDAARGGLVWGFEIDVFGVRDRHRVVAQCKDWHREQTVTPCYLWRLISIAYTVRASPVLVVSEASLSDAAKQVARTWEVSVLRPRHLECESGLPESAQTVGRCRSRELEGRLDDGGRMRELLRRGVEHRTDVEIPLYR